MVRPSALFRVSGLRAEGLGLTSTTSGLEFRSMGLEFRSMPNTLPAQKMFSELLAGAQGAWGRGCKYYERVISGI